MYSALLLSIPTPSPPLLSPLVSLSHTLDSLRQGAVIPKASGKGGTGDAREGGYPREAGLDMPRGRGGGGGKKGVASVQDVTTGATGGTGSEMRGHGVRGRETPWIAALVLDAWRPPRCTAVCHLSVRAPGPPRARVSPLRPPRAGEANRPVSVRPWHEAIGTEREPEDGAGSSRLRRSRASSSGGDRSCASWRGGIDTVCAVSSDGTDVHSALRDTSLLIAVYRLAWVQQREGSPPPPRPSMRPSP